MNSYVYYCKCMHFVPSSIFQLAAMTNSNTEQFSIYNAYASLQLWHHTVGHRANLICSTWELFAKHASIQKSWSFLVCYFLNTNFVHESFSKVLTARTTSLLFFLRQQVFLSSNRPSFSLVDSIGLIPHSFCCGFSFLVSFLSDMPINEKQTVCNIH